MRKALEWLGGSCLVYAALAACSGASATAPDEGPAGIAGMVASSGQRSSGGDAVTPTAGKANATGGAGGLLDPVPPAMAASGAGGGAAVSPEPVVLTQPCDQTIKVGAGNQAAARFDFPGKTVAQLARAVAVVTMSGNDALTTEWFTSRSQFTYLHDGEVGVVCANAGESVTLVL